MFASPAFAQSTSGAAQGSGGYLAIITQMAPLILIFGIFYLLLIRPQQKRMKDQRTLIDATKKGDTVVTAGGLIGKVLKVDGDEVELELGPNVRVRAVKSTLSDVRSSSKPAND